MPAAIPTSPRWLALYAVMIALLLSLGDAALPQHSLVGSSPSADAATLKVYADGPVLFLNKGETRYAGEATATGAIAYLGAVAGGPWGAAAGAAVSSIADNYIEQQLRAGNCIQIKMWYWNPMNIQVSFYHWTPCY